MDIISLVPWMITLASVLGAWWWVQRHTPTSAPPPLPSAPQPALPIIHNDILAYIDTGVLLVQPDSTVTMYNQAASDLLELPPHATGQSLMSLVRDHQFDEFVRHSIMQREPNDMRYAQRNPARTLHIITRPMANHVDALTLVLVRDVTHVSQLERARRDMVASVSHELRTPLASLKLLSETIITNPPPDVAQRMARRISEEVDTLTRLVNDLHDLSRIEAGRIALQMSAYSPIHIIEHAIERIQPQAESNHIALYHTPTINLPDVLVDVGRIDQVFLNLLHNAVKFTPDHGHITIHARVINLPQDQLTDPQPPADHASGEWVLFCITDTGVGIAKEHIDRVFERFYKVDQARTRGSGTGLGLAIARHLIEGHGGRIWVISTVGQGTTFAFTLPTA